MAVKVFIPGYMPRNGAINVAGSTVGECLEHAMRLMPALRETMLDDSGGLNPGFLIIVNDAIILPAGPEKPVNDGDTISIVLVPG